MKTNWIRELFSFSKKERSGIVILLLIIFFLIAIGKLIPLFIPDERTDFSKWEAEVDNYLANSKKQTNEKSSLQLVAFDPNDIDSVSLLNMGLPPKVVSNWIKYRKKGGRFRNKEGVKNIFGMTPVIFERLDSFILIPQKGFSEDKAGREGVVVKSKIELRHDTIFRRTFSKSKSEQVNLLELNNADSLHLLDVPGIGPILASRIIRYRSLLGGYFDVSQLREVYGMREENFTAVARYFTADPSSLKTFNINFSNIQELGRHPYIGFKTARKIFKLRDKMGKFTSPVDLSSVVGSDSLKRLIPYVKFNQ